MVGGDYKAARETGRVWKLLRLVKSMAGAHNGPSPFVFSIAEYMLWGREMEGGKPKACLKHVQLYQTRPAIAALTAQGVSG